MPATTATCRSCQAPILWAKSASGSSVPLNADPVPAGNIALRSDGIAIYLRKGEAPPAGAPVCPEYGSSHSSSLLSSAAAETRASCSAICPGTSAPSPPSSTPRAKSGSTESRHARRRSG